MKDNQSKNQQTSAAAVPARARAGKGTALKRMREYLSDGALRVSEAFWTILENEVPKEEKKLKRNILMILAGTVLFFCAMLTSLARFPLDIYPAGFALLASVGGTGRAKFKKAGEKNAALIGTAAALIVFAGVLASCIFIEKFKMFYLIVYMVVFLCRSALSGGRLDESVITRVTIGAIGAVSMGILISALNGFTLVTVFGAVSLGIITPIFTYLLSGFYIYSNSTLVGALTKRKLYLEATLGTVMFLFLYAIKNVEILSFSLVFVLSVVLTLSIARLRGALYGAVIGMICGMACGGTLYAPVLAIAGFFSGLFFEYSGVVAMMVSFVSACGYSIYSGGFDAFGRVTSDFLCALILFFPLMKSLPKDAQTESRAAANAVMHKETMKEAKQKLKTMSEAFSSLSEVFYTVSDTMKKPQITETTKLVSNCCSEICSHCPISNLCWGREYSAACDATAKIATRLLSVGSVAKADFIEPFSSKCMKLDDLIELINRRFSDMNGNYFKNNKTRLLAGEYSSVSRLIKSTAGDLDRELEYNPAYEIKAKKVLKELAIPYKRVAVFGFREIKIDVFGVALDRVDSCADEILRHFSKEFDCCFEAPSFLVFDESAVMRLKRKRKFILECAKSGCTKKGEALNGDSSGFFETDRDCFYTLICDGMGSGREAAFTSRLASIFIEKLMTCASPKNITLEMLNTFLMSKTDETFTTVDLLEIDLLSGEGNFIKAGAAPSYVLRGDRIHKIESRTPPAGILYNMCAEQTKLALSEGDYVIMLSDGVGNGGEDISWLVKLLAEGNFESAASVCELVFTAANEIGAFQDDLSVSVVKIMKAE